MNRYSKGATAERQLIHMLFKKGFSVARVAGSGSSSLPCPDLLAFNKKKKLAFESKSHKGPYLNISKEQMESTQEWADNAQIQFYIAWKIAREGWIFLKKGHFKKNPKNYSISLGEAKKKGFPFNVITGEQSRLVKK